MGALQRCSSWEGRPFILLVTGWREQSLEVPEELMRITLKGSVAKSSQSPSGETVCLYGDGVTFRWASSEFSCSFWCHASLCWFDAIPMTNADRKRSSCGCNHLCFPAAACLSEPDMLLQLSGLRGSTTSGTLPGCSGEFAQPPPGDAGCSQ